MAADTKRGADKPLVCINDDDISAYWFDLDDVKRSLAAQGLHVVTAAEKAVLDACANAEIESVGGRHRRVTRFVFELQEDSVCRAELARREVPE